jgi:hypothetical protein
LFLVGNPYPSALNAFDYKDNISIANGGYKYNITMEHYIFGNILSNATHVLSGYTGGYATLTLVGGCS